MHKYTLFPFFLNYSTNSEYKNISWPVTSNVTLMTPIISPANGGNLDIWKMLFDNILCVVDKVDMSLQLLQSTLSSFLYMGKIIDSVLSSENSPLFQRDKISS
jgi:hypothetical protein